MPLDEQRRSQLDGIVQQMAANGEPDDAIRFVVNDFKSKYGTPMASATASSPDQQRQDIATEQGSGPIGDLVTGFGKGALKTAVGLGSLVHQIPGVSRAVDAVYGQPGLSAQAFPEAEKRLAASNPAQQAGMHLETAAEMLLPGPAVVRGAKAVPGVVARAAGISKTRAASNLASAADAAKSVAINAELPGQHALRIMQLGETGNYVPAVVRKFAQRVTDPNKAALTFEEARDYASTISKLSANEFGKLAPVVQREVGAMRQALQTALTEAAGTVGKAGEYASGMKEYARAAKARSLATDLTPSLPTVAKAAGGGWLLSHLAQAIGGR